MTIGEKIKLVRAKKKISQQDLGDLAKTHQKNISKYEQDLVVPSAITLKAIADALNVTTDYLLGNEENIIKDTELLKQFKEVDNLPDKLKHSILDVIKAFTRDFRSQQAYSS
jgi:transcriptional regulator with XRE-family HTH domain